MAERWAAHPAFDPYRRWLAAFDDGPPSIATLADLARDARVALPQGRSLAFVPAAPIRQEALAYERRVAERAEVATREGSWHDAFNALAWLAFPRTKAALNAVHVRHAGPGPARHRARDAATLVDESGLILACTDPALVALLREHAWRELFDVRVAAFTRSSRVAVLGHGLLDKLRQPYPALTAHALVIEGAPAATALRDPAALDAAAAEAVSRDDFAPRQLAPLPMAALPGWDVAQRGPERFADTSVFRPKMLR